MQKKTLLILCLIFCFLTAGLISACSHFKGNTFSRFDPSAEESAEFMSSIRPYLGDASSHYSMACFFQQRKKHVLAIEEFRTAVRIDPKFVKALNGMGVSYDALGDHAKAVELYETALKVNPDLPYVLNNLGYALFQQGKLDRAIETYQKAIALNAGNSRYHNNLALAYAQKGEHDKAFTEFKTAGGENRAHLNMARVVDKKDVAAVHLAKAAEITRERKAEAAVRDNTDPQEKVRKILDQFAKKEPAPVPSTEIRTESSQVSRNKPVLRRTMIEVSNGNGVRRMAKKVGNYLNDNRFAFMYLTNADRFNHRETIIYYRSGHIEEARLAARKLPGRQTLQQISDDEQSGPEIRVVIGQDLVRHINVFQRI